MRGKDEHEPDSDDHRAVGGPRARPGRSRALRVSERRSGLPRGQRSGGGGLDGVEAEFDTGFGVTGAVGWASDAATIGTLRTELEVGYRTNEVDKFSGPGGTVSAGDTDLRALSGMVNVALDLSASPLFEPYVMGGIGLGNLEVDFDDFDVDEDDTVFAFQAGAGINVPVGVVTLFGGYRFFGTSDPEFDGVEAEYNSHNLEVGVRVGF